MWSWTAGARRLRPTRSWISRRISFEGYAWFPQYPELRIRRLTEEHGMVTAEGPMPALKVGDMLEAIPVHICPTVNLQNQIYVADGGVLRTEIVAGRGKLQ